MNTASDVPRIMPKKKHTNRRARLPVLAHTSQDVHAELAVKSIGTIEVRSKNYPEWSAYSLARATGLSRTTAGQMLELLCS